MGLRVRFPSASQNVSKLWCPEMDVWPTQATNN